MAKKNRYNDIAKYQAFYESHVQYPNDINNDCWLWTAAKNNIGYGLFRFDGKMRTVHRLQMDWLGYDIKGKIVYHSCDNYHCVNPNHLNVGTRQDMIDLATSKGRLGAWIRDDSRKITCKHCNTAWSSPIYARLHGDNCKHKP